MTPTLPWWIVFPVFLLGMSQGALAMLVYFQSKINERDAKRSGK